MLCPIVAAICLYVLEQNRLASDQRVALAWIGSKQHGIVRYNRQPRENGFVDPSKADFGLVGRWIGGEYVRSMEEISLYDSQLADLSPIESQTQLKYAVIGSDVPLDIGPLGRLLELRHLSIHAKSVTSLKPLYALKNLNYLHLIETNIPIAELEGFKEARPDVQLAISP